MRLFRRAAVLAAVLVACGPGAAAAHATAPNGRPGASSHAKEALARAKQLRQGRGATTGRELTPALRDLFAALPSLAGADRREAEALLARPDSTTDQDPPDTHDWSGPEAPATQSPKCTAHFCVHFTLVGADASDAGYAQSMADLFENEVYACENGTDAAACAGSPGLGWRDPAPDGTLGGDSRVDIYIENLFPDHVFGYVALDPGQPQDPSVPHHAYMVMDNDYTRFGDGSAASGLAAERVTAAHEYNHVLQNAYDYLEDSWMFEATSVYIEDKVYPANNDYLRYLGDWVNNARQPLTTFTASNLKPYGSAVWNHWLDHRFGASIVRNAWERSTAAADFAPDAYSSAIRAAAAGGFADEFGRFAAAVAEWQAPGAGFPDRYPDVPRAGSLPVGSQTVPFPLAHTTFSLFDVPIPASAPPTIRLTGALPGGTAGAIALVGRTGPDPTTGAVTTTLTTMPTGGIAVVSLDNPAQFGRITAVVVDADPARSGFDPTADDWIFTHDANGVALALAEPGPPIVETGALGVVGDHAAVVNAKIDPHLNDTTWSIEYGRTPDYGSKTDAQSLPGGTVGSAAVSSALADLDAKATYHYRVVASNAAGTTTGPDMTLRTARDVTKPIVSIVVKRQRLDRVRRSGVVYLARCSERCAGSARVALRRPIARRLKLSTALGSARVKLQALPRSKTLRVKLNPGATRRLLSIHRNLSVNLRFRAADAAGNVVTVNRRVRLSKSAR